MATSMDARLAPVTARDGADTRNKDNLGKAAAGTEEVTRLGGGVQERVGQTAASVEKGMPKKMKCIVRPCQSGKTRTMQEKIQDMERLARDRGVDGEGYLNVLVTSSNRALVAATTLRMQSIYRTRTESDDDISDSESEYGEPSDDQIEGTAFSWMSGTKYRTNPKELAYGILEENVKMVVACAHAKRMKYIVDLLDILEKSKNFKQRINIWFDEADAYMKLIANRDLDMCKFNRVASVWLVSATWFSVINYYGFIRVEPAERSHPECYRGISDCKITIHDVKCKTAVEYIEDVISARDADLCRPGMRILAPGDITRKSHFAIASSLVSKGFAVAVVNGVTKCVQVPSDTAGEPVVHHLADYSSLIDEDGNVVQESIGELLARMYHDLGLSRYPYAITGQMCLGRGLTFVCGSADPDAPHRYPFQFDKEIIHPFIKNEADSNQCASRGVGNIGDFAGFILPEIIMSKDTSESILRTESIARRLAPFAFETGITDIGPAELEFALHRNRETYERTLAAGDPGASQPVRTVEHRVYRTEEMARQVLKLLDPTYAWRKRNRSDGFYKAAVGGPKAVHTLAHVLKTLPNLTGGKGATATATRYVPCYTDIRDASSARWVVIVPSTASREDVAKADALYVSEHQEHAPEVAVVDIPTI